MQVVNLYFKFLDKILQQKGYEETASFTGKAVVFFGEEEVEGHCYCTLGINLEGAICITDIAFY